MKLKLRHAEFEHIIERSRRRDSQPDVPNSPDSVELFDAIDSMHLHESADLVALLLLAQASAPLDFSLARQQAEVLGQDGVVLLHRTPGLHDQLSLGLQRLRDRVGTVTWTDGGS